MANKKTLKIDPELHKRIKIRASRKGNFIENEVEEILTKGLEVDEPNE